MKACLLVMVFAATAVAAPKKNIAQIYAATHGEKPPKGSTVDNAHGWIKIAEKGNPTEWYGLWITDDGRYLLGSAQLEGHAGDWQWVDGADQKPADDVIPKLALADLWPKQLSAKDQQFVDKAKGDVVLLIIPPRKGTTIHATLAVDEMFGGDEQMTKTARRLLPKTVDLKWDKAAGKFTH